MVKICNRIFLITTFPKLSMYLFDFLNSNSVKNTENGILKCMENNQKFYTYGLLLGMRNYFIVIAQIL